MGEECHVGLGHCRRKNASIGWQWRQAGSASPATLAFSMYCMAIIRIIGATELVKDFSPESSLEDV